MPNTAMEIDVTSYLPRAQSVAIAGRDYRILVPPSAEDLIDEAEYAADERLPYWAELWPSARVLAAELGGLPLPGRRLLELGCGLGLPAIVAADRGARVLATDWYPPALAFTTANADLAGVAVETMLVDWARPPAELIAAGPFDLVVAADVLYEERNGASLGALLPALVAARGEVLITDPRRPHADSLLVRLAAAGWTQTREDRRCPGRPDEAGAVIHLHGLRPPG